MKPGLKSTEFWVNVGVQVVGLLLALGVVTPDQSEVVKQALSDSGQLVSNVVSQVGGIIAMLASAFNYTGKRTELKK
jgi:hypothetical protein